MSYRLPNVPQSKFPTAKKHRHYHIIKWLKSLDPGTLLLDAGAGVMRYKTFCEHVDYTSQDFGEFKNSGEVDIDRWDSSECDIICDIVDIPRASGSFDAILCSEVFEHLLRPDLALKELSRLLKPNGQILLTCPFASSYHQDPYFYSAGYSKYWYQHYAAHFGLEIIDLIEFGDFFSAIYSMLFRFRDHNPDDHQFVSNSAKFIALLESRRKDLGSIVHPQPESIVVLMRKIS